MHVIRGRGKSTTLLQFASSSYAEKTKLSNQRMKCSTISLTKQCDVDAALNGSCHSNPQPPGTGNEAFSWSLSPALPGAASRVKQEERNRSKVRSEGKLFGRRAEHHQTCELHIIFVDASLSQPMLAHFSHALVPVEYANRNKRYGG